MKIQIVAMVAFAFVSLSGCYSKRVERERIIERPKTEVVVHDHELDVEEPEVKRRKVTIYEQTSRNE